MKRSIIVAAAVMCVVAAGVARGSEQSQRLWSRGLVEFHASRYQQALALFDQAVAADASDVYARYYRGVTRGHLDDVDGAVNDLQAVVDARPDLDQAALDLGIALVQKGLYQDAVRWLEQAQRIADLEARASLFLGIAQLRLGQVSSARRNFERAEARDPEQKLAARYYIGVAEYQQGNWSDAQSHFTEVVTASPDSTMGHEAAEFLTKLQRSERARHELYGTAGFQYDSNVVLAPADAVLKAGTGVDNQSDGRFFISAGGNYVPWRTGQAQLTLGYDFYQSLHFHLTDFNLEDHGPSIQLEGSAGPVRAGVLARYDYYLLSTESFLQEATVLPWITIVGGQRGRTEVSYRMRRRDFKKQIFAVRDAFNHAVAIRQYLYLGAEDRYVSLGYQFDRDNPVISNRLARQQRFFETDANSFAYDGNEVSGSIGWTFPERVSAEVSYLYRHERYAAESAQEGTLATVAGGSGNRRRDNEHEVIVALRKPITDMLAVTAAYLGDFNNSNNSLFEYGRHIGSLGMEVRF